MQMTSYSSSLSGWGWSQLAGCVLCINFLWIKTSPGGWVSASSWKLPGSRSSEVPQFTNLLLGYTEVNTTVGGRFFPWGSGPAVVWVVTITTAAFYPPFSCKEPSCALTILTPKQRLLSSVTAQKSHEYFYLNAWNLLLDGGFLGVRGCTFIQKFLMFYTHAHTHPRYLKKMSF